MIKRFTLEVLVPDGVDSEAWLNTYFPDEYVRGSFENTVGDVIYRFQSHPLEDATDEFFANSTLRKVRLHYGSDKGLPSGGLP